MMDLPELEATHNYEERLRRESLRLIATDHDLRKRFRTIEKSMNLIYGYTIDYVAKTNDERAIQTAWSSPIQCCGVRCETRAVGVLPNCLSTNA